MSCWTTPTMPAPTIRPFWLPLWWQHHQRDRALSGIATDGVDRSGTTVKVPNLTGKEWSNAQVQLNIKA